ncbi:hypothetical protein EDB80DRAFT_242213 [Ilyonectria destructans]|nr:hypothetical protein EDB80DRAFT_242213 [Ilyonectria destructans]
MLENLVLFLRDTSLLVWSRRDIYSHISKKPPFAQNRKTGGNHGYSGRSSTFFYSRGCRWWLGPLTPLIPHFLLLAFSGIFWHFLAFSAFSAFAAFYFLFFIFYFLAFGVWRLAFGVWPPLPVPLPLLHDPLTIVYSNICCGIANTPTHPSYSSTGLSPLYPQDPRNQPITHY